MSSGPAGNGWAGGAAGAEYTYRNDPEVISTALERKDMSGLAGHTTKFTHQLALDLIKAIAEYPSLKTACQACGISDHAVHGWLRRAAQPGAAPAIVDFATRFLKADADNARLRMEKADAMMAAGVSGAATAVKFVESRWKVSQTPLLLDLLSGDVKGTDNLEKLLANPTPRLMNVLRKTGWIRHAAWGTPDWGKVINTTGIEAPRQEPPKDP